MAEKVTIDWDKYYKISPVIPHEIIGDEETGLMRIATSQNAFDKFLEFTKGKAINKEKLIKYYKYQNVIYLSDEELYRLNPEYWEELGLLIR